MNFDEMKKAWMCQGNALDVTIDPSQLVRRVKKSNAGQSAALWLVDYSLCLTTFVSLGFYFRSGSRFPAVLVASLMVGGMAVFNISDRILQSCKHKRDPATLHGAVKSRLQQVSHQIWLNERNIWRFILPLDVAMAYSSVAAFIGGLSRADPMTGELFANAALMISFLAVLSWGLHQFSLLAVRKGLMPKKRKLEKLLTSLDEETGFPE